jgi:hypothetical protein
LVKKREENPFSSTRANKRHEKTEVLCATPNTPKHGKVIPFFENPFHGIHFHTSKRGSGCKKVSNEKATGIED